MNINIEATIQDNGALLLTADTEAQQELQDVIEVNERSEMAVLCDLLESYSCNGSFTPFDPAIANPYIGLTEAPCIAENMEYRDDGTNVIDGRFWYYPDYMATSCLRVLADEGRVTFKLASASHETPDNSGLTPAELDAFFQGFVEAMLWSSTPDEDSEHEDLLEYDLAPETRRALRALCEAWTRQHEALLRQYTAKRRADVCEGPVDIFAYAGHDFWLTSVGHGVGYWDRSLGALGNLLTTACDPLAHKMDAYVGDDGFVYVDGMATGQGLWSALEVATA